MNVSDAVITRRDPEAEKLEHWNLFKGWMLELDWAGSKTVEAVRDRLFRSVEQRLNERKKI